MERKRIIQETRAYACLDCGRCTAACPVNRYDAGFSPRRLVQGAVLGEPGALDGRLWSCITCSLCEQRCQSDVNYTGLVKALRAEAFCGGSRGSCTHGGALASLMHLMAREYLKQERLGWLSRDLKVKAAGETVFFTGCQPYFDVVFSELQVGALDSARGAVRLLNRLGITPAVLPDERCCGHDLLWGGDEEGFARLARLNLAALKAAGAKRVITACPECYYTLKTEYPRVAGETGFEIVHITELLAEGRGKLKFKAGPARRLAYHDPCRLGRFSGIYDQPRAVLASLPGIELVEMTRNRANALCCGTQAWLNCGAANKRIQLELLEEARKAGADGLVTACPKCRVHLSCARQDTGQAAASGLELVDLYDLLAGSLG